VAADVREDKVTCEAALRDYGVAIDAATQLVDWAATAEVRGRRRGARASPRHEPVEAC